MTSETQVPMPLDFDLMSYQKGDVGKVSLNAIQIPRVLGQPAIHNSAHQNIYNLVFSYPIFPVYYYSEYATDMEQLTREQIVKRMVVVKNFLFYPKSTIEAITQFKISNFDTFDFVTMGNVVVYIRDAFCHQFNCAVNAGFWYQNFLGLPSGTQCSFGFDIISLHTYLLSCYKRKYSQSVEELYDYFNSRNFIHRSATLHPREFYIQEKNPISIYNPTFFDRFFEKFTVNSITRMSNRHGRTTGCIWDITTKDDERMNIYYTFWRHNESTQYSILPLPPQPPYDLYLQAEMLPKNNTSMPMLICNSMKEFYDTTMQNTTQYKRVKQEDFQLPKCVPLVLYGGVKNLLTANLVGFSECTFYINYERTMTYTFLKMLANIFKESSVKAVIIFPSDFGMSVCPIEELLKCPDQYRIKKADTTSSILNTDSPIPGADRKRVMILDPIIESGTITWIFSKEKAGKTLLALSIAQKVGKGNSEIGTWRSLDPKKVLYIDGEMPGDKLKSHIDRIIRGSGDDPEVTQRAFSVYLFAEHDFDYSYILDEKWQNEHLDELMEYNLIILDNYYTLHESPNAIPLIRWMKKLTRRDIAFIVLDHTNSEGELQGSKVKRRAMDLGLKLELLEHNEIRIDFQCDRYGREHAAKKFNLIACFAASEFSYVIKTKDGAVKQTPEQIAGDDLELLAIFVLKTQGKQNNEVAKQLTITPSQVTKKLKKIGRDAKFKDIAKSQPERDKFKEIEEKAQRFLTAEHESELLDLIELIENRAEK